MSNQNQTVAAPASHSEIANIAFQVFTIAVVGVFSALTLLNIASQIV
jgi:hypothetical protein